MKEIIYKCLCNCREKFVTNRCSQMAKTDSTKTHACEGYEKLSDIAHNNGATTKTTLLKFSLKHLCLTT